MDAMDIALIIMISVLILMHCCFGYAAITSRVDICLNKKILWSGLSLLFGPVGYYAYQGRIPCDLLAKE